MLRGFKTAPGEGRAVTLMVSGFHFFQGRYLLSHKSVPFSTNFYIAESFNLDYVIHFYIHKKGLNSPVFTIKILVVEIFRCY